MYLYFNRFERYARANQWRNEDWATSLGALLTGKAFQVYSRLSDNHAVNYAELKNTPLKRNNLTDEGCKTIRQCTPEVEETHEQFICREKPT